MELAGLRAEVAFVQAEHGLSERRACKLLEVDRSSYDYEPRPAGHAVNVKRVYRLYVAEGLSVRRRRRKRVVRDRSVEPRLMRANQEWSMNFIVDGLSTGRMVRVLKLPDRFETGITSPYAVTLAPLR